VIATGGEGEEGEKVNLKICLARELNPGVKGESLTTIPRRIVKNL
jgi:hypothetical protein